MACCTCPGGVIGELADLVNQIGSSCCSPEPCCDNACCAAPCTCTFPFAQVTMTVPPPICAPTTPQPVKPLCLPCPIPCYKPVHFSEEEREKFRFDNFYNNYNIDYHYNPKKCPVKPNYKKSHGCCEDYTKNNNDDCSPPGCPTGFKPCTMKMTPPPCCNPYLPWCAQVQPCPPKPKKKHNHYEPGPCTRPCCKHWKPKEGPCLYDDPCKAHCFNHPPGMKPSGRWP